MIKKPYNPDPFFLGSFEEKLYEDLKPIKSIYIEGVGFRGHSRKCLRCGKPFKTHVNFICEKCTSVNIKWGSYDN